MKNLFNDLSEFEKSKILEQYQGKLKIDTKKFKNLVETKSGDVIFLSEQPWKSQLEGKSATFYTSSEDAEKAFASNKSNPYAKGVIVAIIHKVEILDGDSLRLEVSTKTAANKNVPTQERSYFFYDKATQSFRYSLDDNNYYSVSVKNIIDKEFFSTDLAKNQNKPNFTIS